MTLRTLSIASGLLLTACAIAAASAQQPPPSGAQPAPAPQKTSVHPPLTGEQVFMTNCSRCHMPPMSISPRTTGTIVMHMRTRARLSQRDEQLLLKYLAP